MMSPDSTCEPTVTLSFLTMPDNCEPTRTSEPTLNRTTPVALTIAPIRRCSAWTIRSAAGLLFVRPKATKEAIALTATTTVAEMITVRRHILFLVENHDDRRIR